MINDYWYMSMKLADNLVSNFQFVPYKLKKGARHEVGKTYWIGYWQQIYKVLEINGYKIKVEWEDGKVAEHMTSLDYMRDYELKPFENKCLKTNSDSYTGAEIKALVYNNAYDCDNMIINDMVEKYFNSKTAPNDYVYYFVNLREIDGKLKIVLKRDVVKSPHKEVNFNHIKRLRDARQDKRIKNVVFMDKNHMVINSAILPDNTLVLDHKYDGKTHTIVLDVEY